jgi:AcrR family transcriptional regulator
MADAIDDGPARVFRALERGELAAEELSARQVCAFLGYTTGHLYHHFGSLDGLLCGVTQLAFAKLGARLLGAGGTGGSDAPAVAQEFVEFGVAYPSLYTLMFERRYDWAALRARGLARESSPGMDLWRGLVAQVAAFGSKKPLEDARLFVAGLHGLVSMALSGRANIGTLEVSDKDAAISAARRLAHLICPAPAASEPAKKTGGGKSTITTRARRRRA